MPAFAEGAVARDLRALVAEALPTRAGTVPPLPLSGLAVDSRAVRPGALFVAVPGAKEDGAAYAADAVRRGAAAVVSERPLSVDVPVVLVPDARAAAADLAAAFHGRPAL